MNNAKKVSLSETGRLFFFAQAAFPCLKKSTPGSTRNASHSLTLLHFYRLTKPQISLKKNAAKQTTPDLYAHAEAIE